MTAVTLADLQASVQDKSAFAKLDDYLAIGLAFLNVLQETRPTRIISTSHRNYVFYQYGPEYGHKITRPLNTDLFIESSGDLQTGFERLVTFLSDLKRYQASAAGKRSNRQYVKSNQVNQVIYTVQQAIGSIGDSFDNPNQSRKRVGQLFRNACQVAHSVCGLDVRTPDNQYPDPELGWL